MAEVQPEVASTWWAFVGDWDDEDGKPDWVHLDKGGLTWAAARDLIRERLQRFRDDDCSYCRRDAAEGVAKLDALQPGEQFAWNVEGDDYVIAAEVVR